MSFQSGDACFPTALAANTASAARESGSIKQIGTAQYVVDVTSVTDTSITYVFRNVSNTATVTKVAAVSPEPCQLLGVSDAAQVGGLIIAAWAATYAIVYLASVIRGAVDGGSNGSDS